LKTAKKGRSKSPADGDLACRSKNEQDYTSVDLVRDLQVMMSSTRDTGRTAWEWIRDMDEELASGTLVLFEGLDTGFGLSAADLERRRSSVKGLLSLSSDLDDELENSVHVWGCRGILTSTSQEPQATNPENSSHTTGRGRVRGQGGGRGRR
jgi:hypothetical protein